MAVIDAIRTDQYAGQGGTYYYNDISGIRTPSTAGNIVVDISKMEILKLN